MFNEEAAVHFTKRDDDIAIVTLNRPEAMNAVNARVASTLEALVGEIEADDDIRVIVLTGTGTKAFCAGADLKEVSRNGLGALISSRSGFAGFVHTVRSKPWIAAVEGLALAGGCELALACDMIVASENGAFGLPEVTRGLIAAAGGLYRLPRAIPPAIAKEIILTGGRLSARRAAEFGLVNRLTPEGAALREALELAGEIAANAPLAVRESLRIARQALDHNDQALRKMSEEARARIVLTKDYQEGPRAFVEKRAPRWVGS